jgi:hypothetical protein
MVGGQYCDSNVQFLRTTPIISIGLCMRVLFVGILPSPIAQTFLARIQKNICLCNPYHAGSFFLYHHRRPSR